MVLVLIVFVLLAAATSMSILRPALARVALTVVTAVAWILADNPVEGPTILKFDHAHGLTVADLVGILAVVIAVVMWWRHRTPPVPGPPPETS